MLHQDLTKEKWQTMPFFHQMANVGTEVGRTIKWREKDARLSQTALNRALELLDLTLGDPKNKIHLKELCRVREVLVDYFMYDNNYGSSDEKWDKYFYAFSYAAAINQ